jgi:hypothetical protein
MYVITLVCSDSDLNQQWSRVLYATVPLSQQNAILALAGDVTKQQLPPGWTQMSDTILRYARLEESLGIGAVTLNGTQWDAACNRTALGSFDHLESAMAAVEGFAALGRSAPAEVRKGLQVALDRICGCPSPGLICRGPREQWCTFCLVRDAIAMLQGAGEPDRDQDQ